MDDLERVQIGDSLQQLADHALHFVHGEGDVLDEREEVVLHVLQHQKSRRPETVHARGWIVWIYLSS